MRIAVLTDIHANREAFEAVLADVAAHCVDRIALLGDIVGYGADPGWCCDKAAELVAEGAICVRGNHDNAASGASEAMSTLARKALDWTRDYTKQRKAFGTPIADFQNTRFKLAEMKTEVEIAQVFIDRCLGEACADGLDKSVAAMAKYWCTELMCRVVDQCLQLHGGYGYIWEYPIARAFADARVHRIYGGSNEIMRELIARTL